MGAAVSSWNGEGYGVEGLTREEVIDIIGEEFYEEEKFLQVMNENERISVEDFKKYLHEYATRYHQQIDESSSYESQGDGEDTFDVNSHETKTLHDDLHEGSHLQPTVSTAKDTKTSTGDDFSESILPPQTIVKMTEAELVTLREELENVYNSLQQYKEFGVYTAQSSHKLHHYRELKKTYYEQTKESIVENPQKIAEDFLAEYYYILDHELVSTRSVSRFYETESTINFGGIPDIVSRRKISRALVNRFLKLKVCHRVTKCEISPTPYSISMYLLTCHATIQINEDTPRKIMEIFYLQDRSDEAKRAKYGPYYIHRQIVVVLDQRPLYHMTETTKPIWSSHGDAPAGDEDLTAEGDEGGSSGYPSEEEKNDDEDDEEEEGGVAEAEDMKDQVKKDDSSSVKSIQIFPRKAYLPSGEEVGGEGGYGGGGGSYDDVSVMSSSVY